VSPRHHLIPHVQPFMFSLARIHAQSSRLVQLISLPDQVILVQTEKDISTAGPRLVQTKSRSRLAELLCPVNHAPDFQVLSS